MAGMVSLLWAAEPSLLWIEGENPSRSQTHRNAWFDAVDPAELSGGAQIANFSEPGQSAGWAEYDLAIPAAGFYHFWLRANPCTGIRYQLDGGDLVRLDPQALEKQDRANWRKPGYVKRVQQWFNVAADGQHDARTMTWYQLGTLELAQGKHTLRFSLGGDEAGAKRFAALDCFVLTTGQFQPNFQYKPGEQPKDLVWLKEKDTWPFQPERDQFSPDALLDLRSLNEETAGQHGFIRLSENGNCTALLFFDPALQKGYNAWLRRIYAEANLYTGVPLAKDPAVAVILIQNEDGMLFWSMQSVKGQALLNLRKLYGDWVVKKYGSFQKAQSAWRGYKHEDDDFAAGRPGMFIVWELTQDARNKKGNGEGREARLADQAEFMGRMQYDFNREIARYLREELGCKQLINAGNWRSADQVILDDGEDAGPDHGPQPFDHQSHGAGRQRDADLQSSDRQRQRRHQAYVA
jgi:hypothetical protein